MRIPFQVPAEGNLVGFVGAIPAYEYAWELHPLFVRKDCRFQGIGTRLVNAMENECANRGAITLYLGIDDELEETSLSNTDLYIDTYEKISERKNGFIYRNLISVC